jgi:hypothetical protein
VKLEQFVWVLAGRDDEGMTSPMNKRVTRAIVAFMLVALGVYVSIIMLGCAAFVWFALLPPRPGAVFETWESEGKKFNIRVTAHKEENGGFVPGAYYRFECLPAGADAWTEIVTFRHDDPGSIPCEQVRRVNDEVAYLIMGWVFAVTSDGGRTWSTWWGNKDPAIERRCGYNLIRGVVINQDGTGTMDVTLLPGDGPAELKFRTRDFGHTWHRD